MAKRKATDAAADPSATAETGSCHGEINEGNGQQSTRRPAISFKCAAGKDNYIEVAVWENEVQYADGNKGRQYAVTFARSYRINDGWVTNHSYRVHELPVLTYLLQKVHDWCLAQRTVEDHPI